MTERDSDIEFDFFEEPEEPEATTEERRVRRGPQRPGRPPTGLTPLLRLLGLVAFAILVVVLLVLWLQSCRGASKKGEYEDYMEQVTAIAQGSREVGNDLNTLLTTRGIKQADLEQQLSGLAQRQQQIVSEAERLDPPGRLREQQRDLVEALQFRVSGLRGLEEAFRTTADVKNPNIAGRLLSNQAKRLDAGDIVWDDRFKDPAIEQLRRDDIGGVQVPDSNFVRDPDLSTVSSMKAIWQRIQGAQTGGTPAGLHGNGIVSVTAQPSGQELSEDEDTTIVATTDLSFDVVVENSGDSQEVRVPVTLTVQKSPSPIVKRQTVASINAGESKTVTFRDFGNLPFGPRTFITVEVKPVPGEENRANNSFEYPVFFSLE